MSGGVTSGPIGRSAFGVVVFSALAFAILFAAEGPLLGAGMSLQGVVGARAAIGQLVTAAPGGRAIYGTVWEDLNADGVWDSGEPGLSGITVYLDADDDGVFDAEEDSTVTSADDAGTPGIDETGQYGLTGLRAGSHTVRQVVLPHFQQTLPGGGAGRSITLSGNDVVTGADFGNTRSPTQTLDVPDLLAPDDTGVSNSDDLTNRNNADGSATLTFNVGSTVTGATVELFADGSLIGSAVASTATTLVTTDGTTLLTDGAHAFTAGQTSPEYLPSDQSSPLAVTIDTTPPNVTVNPLSTFETSPQLTGQIDDAAATVSITVGGSSYPATNVGDGTWSVSQGTIGPLAVGVYDVIVTATDPAGNVGTDVTSDELVILQMGEIRGTTYHDINGNGARDTGEPVLAGWTIYLDLDQDGRLRSNEPSTVTDANGEYAFVVEGLTTYRVREMLQGPWHRSTDYVDVTVGIGEVVTGVDFGNYHLSEIRGTVWDDQNQDGTRDAGEPGLSGWTIYRDENANGQRDPGEQSATMYVTGNYWMIVAPGEHVIAEVLKPEWGQSAPPAGFHTVQLLSGQIVSGIDFGNYGLPGEIRGSKWNDLNGDGVWDTGEPGLSGWTIFLDDNGNGLHDPTEPVTLTGTDGSYEFLDLPVGTHLVAEVVPDDWGRTFPGATVRETRRVSIPHDGSQANDDSEYPSISADGRYVAFVSEATNLVPGDTNGRYDVFVRDLQAGTIERVSVASDGSQGDDDSVGPVISSDGQYVVFRSGASNLVPGDTNGWRDIFVHDRQTGQTERVSIAPDGSQADGSSYHPSISADTRYVTFDSHATNLVPGDTNGQRDIFVHDRQMGSTELVSVASNGSQADSSSNAPGISSDGRYVVFGSGASNLVPGDTNMMGDVFVHDRQTHLTERVSVASDGSQSNGSGSSLASISADGRYVAFHSYARNLVPGDTNGKSDVFVHDRKTGSTERVSIASDGSQANGYSWDCRISANGRYATFYSDASNLVLGDTNGAYDVFVRDRFTGRTDRVSLATDGSQGNSSSRSPAISPDGRYVAFHSYASYLVPGDSNGEGDVFVVALTLDAHKITLEPGQVVEDVNFGNTLLPSPCPDAPNLIASDDTGISDTDNVTQNNNADGVSTLTFSVEGTISGATVELFCDGALIRSAVASGTSILFTTDGSSVLADGTYAFTARQTVPGYPASDRTRGLNMVVDTVAPVVTVYSWTTTDKSPSLGGSVDDNDSIVRVAVQGTEYIADRVRSGTWSLYRGNIAPPLEVGTYDVAVTATDLAGNVGTDSTVDELEILWPGRISGAVWFDVNGDGRCDHDERLEGWTVYLDLDDDGELDQEEPSTLTGQGGWYTFSNLEPGVYRVREVVRPGWEQTCPRTSQSTLIEITPDDKARVRLDFEELAHDEQLRTLWHYERLGAHLFPNLSWPNAFNIYGPTHANWAGSFGLTSASVPTDVIMSTVERTFTLESIDLANTRPAVPTWSSLTLIGDGGEKTETLSGWSGGFQTFTPTQMTDLSEITFSINGAVDQFNQIDNLVLLYNHPSVDGVDFGNRPIPSQIVGRYVLYAGSAWDDDPDIWGVSSSAIAPDKTALLPGQTATFANYTSYSEGINGIMVDIAGAWNVDGLIGWDFWCHSGNTQDPDTWMKHRHPRYYFVLPGEGVGGSDRIVLIWPDGYQVKNAWLKVTLYANERTGLAEDDVFYFGNAIGETGNSATDTYVNAADRLGCRANPHSFLDPAPIDDVYDFNRDKNVNASDRLIARSHPTNFLNCLQLITAPE